MIGSNYKENERLISGEGEKKEKKKKKKQTECMGKASWSLSDWG